jgi:hypothetical protein
METSEFCRLSEEALLGLLRRRPAPGAARASRAQRRVPRWPFPGMVELWLPQEHGGEDYSLATCENLSIHGVAVRFGEPIDPGVELPLAIHQPERTFHGWAVVRHCTRMRKDYFIGMEFLFDRS